MDKSIGLPNSIPGAPGPDLVAWARRAEACGFRHLGTIGRIVYDCHEELVALAAAAGATERIGLMTTVMISPPREPVLLAKQAASLDAISGGRFSLGLGVGWRDDDFIATGRPFQRRGALLDEQIETLRRLWGGGPAADGLGAVGPRPARAGGPPIVLGGSAPRALERVGRLAYAFLAVPSPPAVVADAHQKVLAARQAAGRDGRLPLYTSAYVALGDAAERGRDNLADYYAFGGPEFVATMRGALVSDADALRDVVRGLEDIGADDVFLWPAVADLDQVERIAEVVC